jgi:hypothetical protein
MAKTVAKYFFSTIDATANDMQDVSHLLGPRCEVEIAIDEYVL